MKRLLIDYLDVEPTKNWVDIQTHLNSRLVMTKTRVESTIEQRTPSFKLWQRSDPSKYKFFASDSALHIGSFDQHTEYGRSIILDQCVEMLNTQNSSTEKFISFGTILKQPFDKKETLEQAKFYGRNFDNDSLIDLETGQVVSTDTPGVDFFCYFVLLPIKGIVDTYYLIANNTMIEMPQMINKFINNNWMVRTLEQHDISLREFIIQPSYKDCVKISHDMINPRKETFGIDPFGQSRAVRFPQSEFNQPLIDRNDITLKVRSNMNWIKQDNYYIFDTDHTKVRWIQFKIMANAYFDFQHVNLSLQKTIVVV